MPRLRLPRNIPHDRQELSTVSAENQAVITRAPHPKTGNRLPRAATLTRRPRKDGKEDRAPSTEKKCARRKRQSRSEIAGAALEPQHDGEARVYGEHVADSITAQYKTKPVYEGHEE